MATKSPKQILVVCIDRDNDLGRKAGISGPVVGRKQNLNAAAKLAVADPGESDANSMFAAVKKYDEVKQLYENVEVATLTGHSKRGFESDKVVNEQLEAVLEKFKAEAFVLVSDGAEDDEVLPILQSRAPVISKETVIVKQASGIESTFYTIKEVLRDPFVMALAFGIPGTILLLVAALPSLGLQLALGATGAFFILYGFGIYDRIVAVVRHLGDVVSLQRTSFIFYVATAMILIFGPISAYNTYVVGGPDIVGVAADALSQVVAFTAMAALVFIGGRSMDVVHMRKAFYLKRYFLSAVFAMLSWFIIELAKSVVFGIADFTLFLAGLAISFAVAVAAFRVSGVFDVRRKATKLLVGLPVYSKTGQWLGKVESVDAAKNSIEYKATSGAKPKEAERGSFTLREGRIFVNA